MAKRSGSKSSRSGRRADKERVVRARERGLPERPPEPLRVRAVSPERRSVGADDLSSDAAPQPGVKSSAVPPWVWVAGVALALLAGAYVLSRQRDQALTQPRPEAPSTGAATVSSSESAHESGGTEAPSAPAPPEPAAPESAAHRDSSPPSSVAAPLTPTVEKPVAPKPAAPKAAKPAAVSVPPVVTASPPATVTPPAAPSPVAPPKPADNPY